MKKLQEEKAQQEVDPSFYQTGRRKRFPFGLVMTFLLLIGSLLFHFVMVQPVMHGSIADSAQKAIDAKTAEVKSLATSTHSLYNTIDIFTKQYTQKSCGSGTSFDSKPFLSARNTLESQLEQAARYTKIQKYGIFYSSEVNTIVQKTDTQLIQSISSISSVVPSVEETEQYLHFLQSFSAPCEKLTNFVPGESRVEVVTTFCSDYNDIFRKWKQPRLEWLSKVYTKAQSIHTACLNKKTETITDMTSSLLTAISEQLPVSSIQSDMEHQGENALKIGNQAQTQLQSLIQNKKQFSQLWYLLPIKL